MLFPLTTLEYTIREYRESKTYLHWSFLCFDWNMLTQEIQISTYNDGEPFVPADVIFKESNGSYSAWGGNIVKESKPPIESTPVDVDELPFLIVQQLLRWHFPIGLTDYIPVTEENNPYL